MIWFYCEGDLDILDGFQSMELCGFDNRLLRKMNLTRHQIYNKDKILVTILPVSNPGLFYATVGKRLNEYPSVKVIDEKTAEKLHSELLLEDAKEQIIASKIPTKEEALNSQLLLLLTNIFNLLNERKEN